MKSDWEEALTEFLKGAARVLALGVGNPIRGDDGAGSYAASLLERKDDSPGVPLWGISGGSAPENYLSPCLKFSPSHLIIIDAVDAGLEPGSICQIPESSLIGVSLSSHRMPLGIIVDFFRNEGIHHVMVLGIQPKAIDLGTSMCPEVRKAARSLASTIVRLSMK